MIGILHAKQISTLYTVKTNVHNILHIQKNWPNTSSFEIRENNCFLWSMVRSGLSFKAHKDPKAILNIIGAKVQCTHQNHNHLLHSSKLLPPSVAKHTHRTAFYKRNPTHSNSNTVRISLRL